VIKREGDKMWNSYDNGTTLGTEGSENGIIVKDEEHSDGARITLEKEAHGVPYAITCGIYGLFVHTVYCSDIESSMKQYENMKKDIEKILIELNDDNMSDLLDEFVNKY